MGLLNSNFFLNYIGRFLILLLAHSFWIFQRARSEDDFDIAYSIFARSSTYLIVELIFYVQQKGQVKMFLSKINAKQYEKQLLNLLDTVPDKVLICSQK